MDFLCYFAGCVPASQIFQMSLGDINNLIKSTNPNSLSYRTLLEISFISIIAYFEAFCKNHFASLINICPLLLEFFLKKRSEINIPVKELLHLDHNFKKKLGFLISEKLDFGNARSINSLYYDLISIKPFSKNKIKKWCFSRFISN